MSAPNAGRQSPDPEHQKKNQQNAPANPNEQGAGEEQTKEQLKGLESNPKAPLEDAAKAKTSKGEGNDSGKVA